MDAPPFKPATIEKRAAWERIAKEPAAAALVGREINKLDDIPPTMPLPTAADYLAARRSNDRGRLDDHWRKVRPNLARLTVNRLLKGIDPSDADDRLLNWIFAFIYQPTWVVSAHLPKNDLPLSGEGQLDLSGCESAGELAELREVLLPWMNTQTQTLGDSIVREIDRRVLTPFMASEAPAWWAKLDAKRTDERRLNNWTGVCAGSILTACLSLEATGAQRPEARDRALKLLRVFFDVAFGESGECEEGIGYWNYGVEFALLGMMRLPPEQLAASFDLDRIRLVAEYPQRCHILGKTFFAGNDSATTATTSPSVIPWLADLVDSSFLRWWSSLPGSTPPRTVPHVLRQLQGPIAVATQTAAPTHEPNRLLPDQQAAIFQRPSGRGLFTFTITGGTNAELHNHNDLGTFQLFLDERPIVPDLGAPEYVTDFFDEKVRYTKYLVAASGGHCCPMINGVEQRAGAEAAGKLIGWHPDTGEIALDLTSAYPPAAKLKRWTRSAHVPVDDAVAFVIDEFEIDGDGEVIHRIWFIDEPKINDGGTTIEADGAVLRIDPKPATADVMKIQANDAKLMLRAFKGKMLYRVDLRFHVEAGRPLTLHTKLAVASF